MFTKSLANNFELSKECGFNSATVKQVENSILTWIEKLRLARLFCCLDYQLSLFDYFRNCDETFNQLLWSFLVKDLSVAENTCLGLEPKQFA